MIKAIALVGIGGAAGSILRYLLSVVSAKYFVSAFPVATFATNIVGCLLIGLFAGWIDRVLMGDPTWRLLLLTGFCGGFTTFSAFAIENLRLLQNGHLPTAFLYISLSVVLGIAAVTAGLALARG
jgi:CrcB protein